MDSYRFFTDKVIEKIIDNNLPPLCFSVNGLKFRLDGKRNKNIKRYQIMKYKRDGGKNNKNFIIHKCYLSVIREIGRHDMVEWLNS